MSQCCVPSCSLVDIKAEKCELTWEVIRDSVWIASVESLRDISLCTKHYQQIYNIGYLMLRHVHANPDPK